MTDPIQKSTGSYMSVDADAAVERNRPVIEQIRGLVDAQRTDATEGCDRCGWKVCRCEDADGPRCVCCAGPIFPLIGEPTIRGCVNEECAAYISTARRPALAAARLDCPHCLPAEHGAVIEPCPLCGSTRCTHRERWDYAALREHTMNLKGRLAAAEARIAELETNFIEFHREGDAHIAERDRQIALLSARLDESRIVRGESDKQITELQTALVGAQKIVEAQSGCWFVAETAAESYLQRELRRLHAALAKS